MLYDAFISYSHEDRRFARAIQDELYGFSKPWAELAELRLYRDDTHTAIGNDLRPTVIEALKKSRFLILIASPHAARSKWVELEVATFVATHPPRAILIVLASGALVWDVEASRFQGDSAGVFSKLEQVFKEEPVYLDLSWANDAQALSLRDPRFQDSIASLASVIREVPKEQLVGNYISEQRKRRRGQRINLGFRGAIGFAAGPIVALVAVSQILPSELSSAVTIFAAIAMFAAVGLLGAVTCGVGVRGALGFALGFAFLTPAYVVGGISPFPGAWGDAAFLWMLCVLGFGVAGSLGASMAQRSRASDGGIAFAIGGIVASSAWLLFPDLRSSNLDTRLFGPWQTERAILLLDRALNSIVKAHLAPLAIGAGLGGLLFGIRLAGRAVDFGLTPSPSLFARWAERITSRHFRTAASAMLLVGTIFWATSLTDWFQRHAAASRLKADVLGAEFSTLHINYGYSDPDLFRLVLRARRDLSAIGRQDEAARFSALLGKLASEYQGYPDLFPDRWDGLVDVAISFLQTGGKDYLKRLLVNAEKNASPPLEPKHSSNSKVEPKGDQPNVAGRLQYDFNRGNALLAVASGWAVYGDRDRTQRLLAHAREAAKSDRKPLDPEFAARAAVSLLSVGKRDEAQSVLSNVNFVGSSINLEVAITLLNAKLWPEQAATAATKEPGGLIQAVQLVRAHRCAEALAMFSGPGQVDLVNQSAAPVVSAAINAGERETAFAILDIATAKAYRDIHTEPRLPLLDAMVEAAKKHRDAATLNRIVDELKRDAKQRVSGNYIYMDSDSREKLVKVLKMLIDAGEAEFVARLTDKSFQDHEVYLALAKYYLQAQRPHAAHDQIVRAWHRIYSAYNDYTDLPIDRIAELCLETGDLRGTRFIADDYGIHPSSAEKLAKQMTLYCAILEKSIDSLRRQSRTSASVSRSY